MMVANKCDRGFERDDHTLEIARQVQAPRSAAESEVASVAYAGQFGEGIAQLYRSMGVKLKKPILFAITERRAVPRQAPTTGGPKRWSTESWAFGAWSKWES